MTAERSLGHGSRRQHAFAADVQAVALKAYSRIADHWKLTLEDAAGLADMSVSTWKRARKPDSPAA